MNRVQDESELPDTDQLEAERVDVPRPRLDRSLDAALPEHSPGHVIAFHHAGTGTGTGTVRLEGVRSACCVGPALAPAPAFEQIAGDYLERLLQARKPACERLSLELSRLTTGLAELLSSDAGLAPEAHSPAVLARAAGALAGAQLDLSALAERLPPARGPVRLSERRRTHVSALCECLRGAHDRFSVPELRALCASGVPAPVTRSALDVVHTGEPYATARSEQAASVRERLSLARAMRAAQLELAHAYDPVLHDAVLSGLTLADLSDDERLALPMTVVIDVYARVHPRLSALLSSEHPLHVLAWLSPAADLDRVMTAPPPASLAQAHGRALWLQASAAHPAQLEDGLARMACAAGSAVGLILAGPDAVDLQLAVESRVFPLLLVDPQASELEQRFQLHDRPGHGTARATRELTCTDESGRARTLSLCVTLPDLSVRDPQGRQGLYPIASGDWATDQWPLDRFVDAWERGELGGQVPYVWVVDEHGLLQRAIVERGLSRRAVAVAHAYRALSACAGLDNPWAHRAEALTRAKVSAEAEAARAALFADHERALSSARAEAGSEALRRLAEALLSLDPLAPARATAPAPIANEAVSTASEAVSTASEGAPTGEPADADFALPDDPYVESARCTTCNECTQKFPHLFAYDDNKQAQFIAAEPAPFAQLVLAAENCPARCIHTGKPRADDATVSDALVARAAPFL